MSRCYDLLWKPIHGGMLMGIRIVPKTTKFSVFDLQKLSSSQNMIFGADYVLIKPNTFGCTLHLADTHCRLNVGQLVLLAPFSPFRLSLDPHYNNVSEPLDCDVLHFRLNGLGQTFTDSKQFNTISQMLNKSKYATLYEGIEVIEVGELIYQLKNSFDFCYIVAFLNLLDKLSSLSPKQSLIKNCVSINQSKRAEDKLTNVIRYIKSHLTDSMTVAEVGKVVYMAESSFSRFFHANMGLTFWQYVIEQRIRLASKMLIQSDKSISFIAADSGFSSISGFNCKFKSLLNVTPRQYRETHKGMQVDIAHSRTVKNQIRRQLVSIA